MKKLIPILLVMLMIPAGALAQARSSMARRVQTPLSDPSPCPAGTVWVRAGVFKVCLTDDVASSYTPSSLSGSGAAGRVALWGGASSLSSDTGLTFDGTNDDLTIGRDVVAGRNFSGVGAILSGLTASRAVVTDGSKNLASSATTSTEIGYLSGVTSALQTQLDGKQATLTNSAGLRGALSDESGTGAALFAGGNIGAATGTSLSISGTGGAGFLEIANQSSAPGTPTSAGRLYFDNSNRLSWRGTNGFVRTFDGTSNTADRTYTLPDAAGTVALAGRTGAFTASFGTGVGATSTNYVSPGFTSISGTEAQRQIQMPFAGTIFGFCVHAGAAQSGTGSLVWTIRVNGADSTVIATIAANATAGCDTTHSASYAANDLISISVVNNASATSAANVVGTFFVQ